MTTLLPINRFTLPNGLKFVVVENHSLPVFSVNLLYRVGSKDEKRGKTGLAHLFEHLMFEGTKKVPKGEFDKICSMAGGTNNAYTCYDWTSYTNTFPENQLELAFWLESDRMFNFAPSQFALDTQKKVVSEEIYQTIDNQPYSKWRRHITRLAYSPESSYSWEVPGYVEDVNNFSLEDIFDFKEKFYQAHNAVMVITGKVDTNEVEKLAAKYFDFNCNNQQKEIQNKIERNIFYSNYLNKQVSDTFFDEISHEAVFLAFHIPGFYDENTLDIAELYTNMAAGGKSSFLHQSMVYQKQIAQAVGVFIDRREHASLMIFYAIASSSETSAEQLGEILLEEILSGNKSKLDIESFEKSQNFILNQNANEYLYNYNIADNVAYFEMFFDKAELYQSKIENFEKINMNDVEKFVQEYIREENLIKLFAKKNQK